MESTSQQLVPIVQEDEQDVFDWVKSSLGGDIITLELTDKTLQNFLKQALAKYSRVCPTLQYFSLGASPGVQEYYPDKSTIGYGIVDVMIPRLDPIAPMLLSSGPRLDIFGYRYSYPYRDISELTIDYYYFAEATRVLSSDFDWEYFNGALHIHPSPDEAFTLTYVAAHPRSVATMPAADIDWVRNYTLAQAIRSQGYTRRKFNIPGAQTGQRMDGDQQVAEGNAMLQALEQDLMLRAEPFPLLRNF